MMELTVKRVNLVFFMLLMEQTVKENLEHPESLEMMELTVKRVNLVFFMLLMEQTVKENPVILELQVSQEAKDQRVNEEMMDPRVTRVNLDPLGSLEPPELKEGQGSKGERGDDGPQGDTD